MAFEGVVIGADFDTAKAEAKMRKLQREYDIAKKKVENKKIEIDMATVNTNKIYSDLNKISAQIKEKEIEIKETLKWIDHYEQKGSVTGVQKEKEKLSIQQAELEKLKELEIKKNQLLDSETFKIQGQEIELEKLKNKQVEIGEKIALNGKKQNKFTQAFEKSQKSADRFGKRLKSLIASALFFSVVTKAFTALRNEFGELITETGTKTASLVSQLKSNLATIGRTLYESVKPHIEWLLEKLVQITQLLSQAIAKALGKNVHEMKKLANTSKDVAENSEKSTASFDSLQKITDTSTSNSESRETSASATTGPADDELQKTEEQLDNILELVGEIGLGFLAWKVSKTFLGDLKSIPLAIGVVGFVDAFDSQLKEGLNWKNLAQGAISMGLVGASIGFALGGPGGAILGFAIGVGLDLLIQGITSVVKEGAKTENIGALIAGALFGVASIIGAIRLFNSKHKAPTKEVATATNTVTATDTGTSKLTGKLKSLVKNLALGIAIIAEVAIAAGFVVAAIWGLGLLLEQVGIAWQPVIDNAATVAIAMGVGIVLLAGIGVVTALLGSMGVSLIVNLALGIAVLALLGVSAALFLAEIILIGVLLQQVGIAWQPVLDNGETIATGIGIGTGLLVGIGVVTAALGAATVATAGALPLAIALGTAILIELGVAFVAFVKELVIVADQLSQNLYPALNRLNEKLPELSTNMEDFTNYMKFFASKVVDYTKSSAIAGFSSTVDSIVKFFTKDPIESLAEDANKQYDQAIKLNKNLNAANPALNNSISLMQKYYELLKQLQKLTQKIDKVSLSKSIFKSFKSIIGNIGSSIIDVFNVSTPALAVNATNYSVPALATGAILPGGSPMLAWVNDQPKGQPYVEGSIDNIAAAFEKYLGDKNFGNQNLTIEAKGSWAQFIKFMNLEIKKESNRASVWG